MIFRILRSAWLTTVFLGVLCLPLMQARAEDADPAKLTAAVKDARTTLEQGLKVSEQKGKPISAKFEIAEGQLQLSVYTMGRDGFEEVLVDPAAGTVKSAEKITDADDLAHASAQKAAMEKAGITLLSATERAARENAGGRAISAIPERKDDHPIAQIAVLRAGGITTVPEKLD